MNPYLAVIVAALVVVFAAPVRAAEACDQVCEMKCKTLVKCSEDDDECCRVIQINKDGEKKVIKLQGGLLDTGDELDTETHLKLLDARIAYVKATGQLRTDLAVKRAEAKKLELTKKPDAEVVAKKKEINALKARLADHNLDYEQTVKKLVPEGMHQLYMLGIDDDASLLDLTFGLPVGSHRSIIKCIQSEDDDDEEEDD